MLSHQDDDTPGDWIELRNTTANSINISGWFLSDSRSALTKYKITNTTIQANGYAVFTEYSHFKTNFALSEFGDSVYLSAGSGGKLATPAYRESVSFGGQERNVTFGRYVKSDGSVDFPAMASATTNAANSAPRVGPVVFDQIMYNPLFGGYEYLRLKNTSNSVVELYDPLNPSNTWKVSGIDFHFPTGTELTAGDSLILVRDTISAEAFRTLFSVPSSIDIFNYSGALDNDTDTLVLEKPDEPEIATGFVKYITVERVKYSDHDPWPAEADGLGKALGRINPATYGDDVINWQAEDPDYAYIPPNYLLTVNSGSGDGTYPAGTVVPIQADPPGSDRTFSTWTGHTAGIANKTAPSTTLTMPASNVTITAVYVTNCLLTVHSGSGDGTYPAGTVVPIQADPPGTGRAFSRWTGNTSAVSSVISASASITMPAQHITVTAAYASNTTLVAQGAVWKYNDLGTNLYTAWRNTGYNDSIWSNGPAKLGYGDNAVTVVSYGPDSSNRYITTYFRKNFTVTNASAVTSLTLNLLRDDGAVVYLNGTEVLRDNMPSG
ncbi:MAG: lamin tail domain-containing protein, partial [Pontiellaceae bacterium]|nr:lamin tail domain-containing protein [Pontiellaceae bacterium]